MARAVGPLSAARVRARREAVEERIARAAGRVGRRASEVTLLAATKYVATEQLEVLLEAGLTVFGENRAQALKERARQFGKDARFDYIGNLQHGRVREIAPYVHLIHSLASDSAAEALRRHPPRSGRGVLVEVNLSGEESKGGVAPDELDRLLARCPIPVEGLMTMPPPAHDPQQSRPYFSALRELALKRGLPELSMGTSQDFEVAVEEGATIVRIGTTLYQ